MARFKNVSRRPSKLRTLMVFAPVALELLTRYRNGQKAKRGRLYRPSKRGQLLDAALNQANRRFGRQGERSGKGRGFF